MKKLFSFFFLLCALPMYADLVITPDMLGGEYSITLGESITVSPKEGYEVDDDAPHFATSGFECDMVSHRGWSLTPTCAVDWVFISYAYTATEVRVNFPAPPTYTLTVIDGSGSGSYEAGTQVSITANTPPAEQIFDKWTGDVSGVDDVNEAGTTFTMGSADATITATYKNAPPPSYTLTVVGGSGSGEYTAGTQVAIVANTPEGSKVFDQWTSDSDGNFTDATSATTTFTMPATAATVTATYKDAPAATYPLTVIGGSGSGNYTAGTQVPIAANSPESGKVFDQWTSDGGGSFTDATSASTTFIMPAAATTVTATYKDAPAATYPLTVIGGSGSGNYAAGTEIVITANTPADGKVFDKWTSTEGSFASAISASTTFTMPSGATTVTATYKDAPASVYTLTVISGSGSGNYTAGTPIPIVANTPANGKVFDTWTSDSGSFADANSAGTTFTMPANAATVTATYKDAPASVYTLTVINGTGSGNYTAGIQVSIVANTPASGKVFDKWTSDSGSFADANSATTTFMMPSAAATVTATYMDDIPDGMGEVSDNELSVRGIEKGLYIRSSKDGTAYIYTTSGRLVKVAPYHVGRTAIDVPAGIWIVRAGVQTFRVYVK
jgi:hypothetical protein